MEHSAQSKPVWSVGAKWMAAHENFLKPASWINDLSLRATYGITGNAPAPGTSASKTILTIESDVFDGNGSEVTPGNRLLTWETTKTLNLGIDFGFLKNRIRGSLDYYDKKTTNLIGKLNTNPISGFTSITGNFGDLSNTGVELSLSTVNVLSRDFSWSSTLTTAFNKNKITRLVQPPLTLGI